jgi:hypothetical protein
MIQPSGRTLIEGVYGRLASMLNFAQSKFVPWRPMWIHMVFRKDGVGGSPKKS